MKILFAGDYYNQSNSINLSKELKQLFNSHEIISCNFEAPIIDIGFKAIPKAGPAIHHSEKDFSIAKQLGFNLFSLSNNHIADFGEQGIKKTIATIGKENIVGAGTLHEAFEHKTITINERKVSFLSFSEWGFGIFDNINQAKHSYSWVYHSKVETAIKEAVNNSDFVFIQIHAGVEETEIPLPEWRSLYKKFIDLGCDGVIAHHPHVSQGWEIYKEKLIAYSLGNFYFPYQNDDFRWNKSIICSIELNDNKNYSYKFYQTEFSKHEIKISESANFKKYLTECNNKLTEGMYEKEVELLIATLWKERYEYFHTAALNGFSKYSNLLKSISRLLRSFLNNRNINYTLLRHNLSIESHRYVSERAINQILENKTPDLNPRS